MARKRIGELLVERALINPAQLEEGLAHHRQTRVRLGVALIQKGFLSEDQLANALADALGIPIVDLKATQPEWSAIHMLRAAFCEQHDLFPFAMLAAPTSGSGEKPKPGSRSPQPRKQLLVAMSDPLNVPAIEEIEFTTGLKVAPRMATLSAVRASIRRYYHKVNPDTPTEGPVEVIHSKGGGSVRLERGGSPAPDEDVIEGELVETEAAAPKTADALDDLFSLASPGKSASPPPKASAPAKAPVKPKTPVDALSSDLDYLFGSKELPDPVERLEHKFWTLLKLMADKGLITREEFAKALEESESD